MHYTIDIRPQPAGLDPRGGPSYGRDERTSSTSPETLPSGTRKKIRLLAAGEHNEPLPVRHGHLRQRLRVHGLALRDDAVEVEQVRNHPVDLVAGEGLRLVERHCPPDVVEQGCGIGPIAADGLYGRLVARQRALAADQAVVWSASALLAVARLALRHVHGFALLHGAAARRQAGAVGAYADVPGGEVFG